MPGKLEEAHDWYEDIKDNPIMAFKSAERREQLAAFDMSALRAASWSVEVPPPGVVEQYEGDSEESGEEIAAGPYYEC